LPGLGAEILRTTLRSIAPLNAIRRSLGSYLLLLWKTRNEKIQIYRKRYIATGNTSSSRLRL
jgi:hypothetical protein